LVCENKNAVKDLVKNTPCVKCGGKLKIAGHIAIVKCSNPNCNDEHGLTAEINEKTKTARISVYEWKEQQKQEKGVFK